ncbi:MAG: FAD-dependent oxidoreductase [Proteobacteria bacterium]|nr:FAD-dependent oxidoreductase [Pseudomonadota bacterium]MBU1737063.1 FAD-dependent oxidoreductase [Pseudomonadota bacterium]
MNAYQTKFIERIERTPSSVSYRFARPDGLAFTAGQYMLVDLGDKLVHPLSLSDCPEETGYIEFTKRMTGSPYCEKLESLARGIPATVKGPTGKFICEEASGTIVMIAGGIGITPIRSILKSHEKKKGSACKIVLLYGNLNKDDIAFRAELENLALPDYRLVHVLSDPTGMDNAHQGFITAEVITKEVPDYPGATYMISGPPVMVEAMKKALAAISVKEDQVRTDIFLGYD